MNGTRMIGVGEILFAVGLAAVAVVFENRFAQFQLPALLVAVFAGASGLRRLR